MDKLRCPECGDTDIIHIEGDKYQCLNCDNVFTEQDGKDG
jgi:rubredoxin